MIEVFDLVEMKWRQPIKLAPYMINTPILLYSFANPGYIYAFVDFLSDNHYNYGILNKPFETGFLKGTFIDFGVSWEQWNLTEHGFQYYTPYVIPIPEELTNCETHVN